MTNTNYMKKNFKDLTKSDIEYIKALYYSKVSHNEKIELLSNKFGVVDRTIRAWWQRLQLGDGDSIFLPKQLKKAIKRELPEDVDILLVTSAQNKTVINGPMFKNMKAYCDFLFQEFGLVAAIMVIPARYRNPTSPVESDQTKADEWWDDHVDDLLYYNKIAFGDTIISADSRVRPTANMPLNGYESMCGDNHLVIGHPRIHFKAMPRFRGEKQRFMTTTGFLTVKNYSRSKSGDKGFVHHSYGFVVLEKKKDETCYAPRPVKVNGDGSFTDIRYHVENQKVNIVKKCSGFIYGDIHHREVNGDKMYASKNLVDLLNPEKVIFHDLFDASTVNPHEQDDLFIRKLKISQGLHLIDQEVEESLEFLQQYRENYDGEMYVVQSNHDDFLDRHINKFNWKTDLHNSEAYLKYAMIQQSVDLRNSGNIYGHIIGSRFDGGVTYLKNCDPLKINSYQCGHHGDHGVNGAKGNITSFKNLNTKMIHGHGHTPMMLDGVTMVGVSCNLWQYYNSKGMSSWSFADSIVHESGKNQLIVYDEDTLEFTRLLG
jgi:hypothetical protein